MQPAVFESVAADGRSAPQATTLVAAAIAPWLEARLALRRPTED